MVVIIWENSLSLHSYLINMVIVWNKFLEYVIIMIMKLQKN